MEYNYIINQDIDGTDVTLRKLQLVLLSMLKDIDKIAYNNRQELTKDFQENKKFYIMKY